MTGRIYIIKNTINEKVYIGQTKDSLQKRFGKHLSSCEYVIGKAIRKYGKDKFSIELLEEVDLEDINAREIFWISEFNSTYSKLGYNMSIGGNVTRKPRSFDAKTIIDLFNAGMTVVKIAKYIKTDVSNITNILKENNIKYGVELQKVSEMVELGVIEDYTNLMPTMTVADKYNIRKGTVRRILLRNGISIRNYSENKIARRNLLLARVPLHESIAPQP